MKRRHFVKVSALAAGSLIIPQPLKANTEKIKLAILGTGWWGTDILLENAMPTGRFDIVGLCDVNETALHKAAKKVVDAGFSKPQLFSSYKEMYNLPGLQAVAIATPTHWHALQFIAACEKGLHVFLEKPISYDIREGQAMLAAKQKANNVVQVDFPRVMVNTNDEVKNYIESGAAGKIMQVQANIISDERPLVEKEIPDTLDFDTFCGPAPMQKFLCNDKGENSVWRGQFELSRGILVDWGIHYIHNIREVLGLGLPDHVSAAGGIISGDKRENPDYLDVRFEYGELPVQWSHKTWGYTSPNPDYNIGVYYYGSKATIFAGDLGWEVFPKDGSEKIKHGDVRFNPGEPGNWDIYRKMFTDMFVEFADGIILNSNAGITNTFEEAEKTTSTVIYGDMAYRTNSYLAVDTVDESLLKREYRKPYKHPYSM